MGSDPNVTEVFLPIWEAPSSTGDPSDPARTVRRVSLANAGGNRFLWRVDFLAEYPVTNSSLVIYLDADNDAETGRQQGIGSEFMLQLDNGLARVTAFARDGENTNAAAPRIVAHGDSVFFSYDVELAQEDGGSVFRLNVLSETKEPHRSVHATGFFAAKGPPLDSRTKFDLTESVGVEQTWGLNRIDAQVEDPANVPIRIRDCKLDGFRFDKSEYRNDNALRSGSGPGVEMITATVPPGTGGPFYPGFILYDGPGREVVGIDVGGQRRGIAVADFDGNNQHLFFLREPVELKPGDEVQLRVLGTNGSYRTEDLILLRQPPPARPPLDEFQQIALTENRLTWISTWATKCTVDYTLGNTSTAITESFRSQNHRVALEKVRPGDSVRYRIRATARNGREVSSGWREAAWNPLLEPPTRRTESVSLEVTPPADAAGRLTDWPVTSGVPFPGGALGSARNVRLLNADGKTVPLQARVTGRWADGSVKWLLLDFRHSGGSATYTLEFGPDVSRVEPDHPFTAPANLGELALTDAGGVVHQASLTGFVEEETGGLRRCLHTAGELGESPFRGEARVHVYPGLPWARVLLTFVYGQDTHEFSTIRSLVWQMPSARGARQFVRQHTDDRFESSDGGGKRFSGAVGPVFLRDFWQNYPKDLEQGPEGTSLWLMPLLTPNEYDWAKETPFDESKLFYWFDPKGAGGEVGGYKLRQGMSKTHEVWIGLDGSKPPLDRPLFAVAPPAWYAESGAFGEITIADATRPVVRDYDKNVTDTFTAYLANREKNREFGFLNFGDWWGERLVNWGNTEYDTQHALFLQFARSGDLRFLRAGEEAEMHNRDVDTVHEHSNASRIGSVYMHCIGHVGDYYAKSPLPDPNQGILGGGFTVTHTWCEGHMDHYFLTGDRRSLETGRKIADHYASYGLMDYDFTNAREAGWHLILTMAVYRATGDPFYLNAARIITERVLERQTPEPIFNTHGGGWRRMLIPGHCTCLQPHYGNAGFMVGVLLTGLKLVHLETRDPRVAESIIHGAHFLIDDMWEEDVGGFRSTSCPKSSKGPFSNFMMFDGIGYAYHLSQQAGQPDQKLAEHLRKGTAPAIKPMTSMGKHFSQFARVSPHFIGLLAELSEEQDAPPAFPEK